MDMQMYISVIEKIVDGLGIPGIYLATGVVAFCIFTTLLTLISSGLKNAKLNKAQAKEQAKHEAALAQAIAQTQTLQTQAQQLEAQLQQKTSDHQQLAQQTKQRTDALRQLLQGLAQNPALQLAGTTDIDSAPEAALWQQHGVVIAELSDGLQNYQQQTAKLSAQNRSYKNHIDRLEVARMQVFNDLNLAVRKAGQLETAFIAELGQQQARNAQLEAQNQAYKVTIDKLELNRMQVFNELNQAIQKSHGLELRLNATLQQQQADAEHALAKLQTENQAYLAAFEKQERERMQAVNDLNVASQKISQLETTLKDQEKPVETIRPEPLAPKQETPEPPRAEQAPIPAIDSEPAESIKQNTPLFARFANTLGLGKQQPAEKDGDAEAKKAQTPPEAPELPHEEKSAVPMNDESAEAAKPSNPLFSKVMTTLGLGKTQTSADHSAEAKAEPLQTVVEIASTEEVKAAEPLFNKLINSIGLSKQTPATNTRQEEIQAVTEPQPANEKTATKNAAKMTGQLKSFFKK